MKKKNSVIYYFLLLIASMIWGSAFVAQSVGMDYIGPFTFTAVRNFIGAAVLVPFILFVDRKNQRDNVKFYGRNGEEISHKQLIHNSILGGIFCGFALCAASNFQQFGICYTTVGKGGFITTLYVVLVPIAGLFFKKKTTPAIWIAVVLSVVGLYLLCMSGDTLTFGRGELLVFICAILFTVQIMMIDHFTAGADPVLLSSIQFLVCGIISSVFMFAFETPNVSAIISAAVPILYAGVLSSGVAYTLQAVAQKNTNPTMASLIMCLESVFSAVSGWIVLKESMTGREIFGCVLMFGAILLAQIPAGSRQGKKKIPVTMVLMLLMGCITGCDDANEIESISSKNVVEIEEETQAANGTTKHEFIEYEFNIPGHTIPDSEALKFTRKMGYGWNLGNTFDAYDCDVSNELKYESAWCGTITSKENILKIKEAGFNTIRIPVSWHNHLDENGNISDEWLNRVKEVVDYAYDEDMYVIINIHHDDGEGMLFPSYDMIDQSVEYITNIWSRVATEFGDYDEHLIFETMNEPRTVGTKFEWALPPDVLEVTKEYTDCINRMNQTAVDTIRAAEGKYNKSRYIMCPAYDASPDYICNDSFVIPSDTQADEENRILLSIHLYRPYSFCLAAQNESESESSFTTMHDVQTGEVDSALEPIYDKYISEGYGVVLGEFGARNKNDNNKSRALYAAYTSQKAMSLGIPVILWDNNLAIGQDDEEQFGILDRETNEFVYPQIIEAITGKEVITDGVD